MNNQGPDPKNKGTGSKHILVVEKDSLQGYLLEDMLQERGWVVRLAEDPGAALLYCEHDRFSAAIINDNYPGSKNGFELAELLRTRYRLPSLMITASRHADLEKKPAFNPSQELLFKPYRLMECRVRLQDLLAEPK